MMSSSRRLPVTTLTRTYELSEKISSVSDIPLFHLICASILACCGMFYQAIALVMSCTYVRLLLVPCILAQVKEIMHIHCLFHLSYSHTRNVPLSFDTFRSGRTHIYNIAGLGADISGCSRVLARGSVILRCTTMSSSGKT